MNNLLSNASKFSEPGDEVEVSIARHGRLVRISVTDHGAGISDDFKKDIFTKFSQEDSSVTRAKTGTGLGLAISKLIIEKHGGKIDFVSKQNIGSSFYFDLPRVNPDYDAAELFPDVTNSLKAPRILVIEDDPDVGALLTQMLAAKGYNSDVANTGKQARKMLTDGKQHYDLVTLDLVLPDEDGVELMHWIHDLDNTDRLPVIVISAIADETRREINGSAMDVIDWLDKPVDTNRLDRSIGLALQCSDNPVILHVEDDPEILYICSTLLKGKCELIPATTMASASDILKRRKLDLVLLDAELPDGSGLDLIPAIHNNTGNPGIIIFSGHDISSDIADSVNSVLLKSQSTTEELLSQIIRNIPENNNGASSHT